jgi:hypothetical protein
MKSGNAECSGAGKHLLEGIKMKAHVVIGMICLIILCAGRCAAQDNATLKRAETYEPLMAEAGARHKVDPRLLWVIAYLETRFRTYLVSRTGARGIMQFMPATAARFNLANPHDAAGAINAAARYLNALQEMFGGRLDLILAAYNAGEGAVKAFRDGQRLVLSNGKVINPKGIKTGGVPPYRETTGYVKNGVALFTRLTERELLTNYSAKHRDILVPAVKSLAKGSESVPLEIIKLKEGSIYIVDATSATNSVIRQSRDEGTPHSASSKSIYFR